MAIAGERLESYATLPGFETGRTISYLLHRDPNGNPLDTLRLSNVELGGGSYAVYYQTLVTDPPGHYYIEYQFNDPGASVFVENDWDLTPAGFTQVVVPGYTTRRNLRRLILRKFGDLILLKATAPGGPDSLVDTTKLILEPGHYRGREVIFTAGTVGNLGLTRYVDGSSRDSHFIHFSQDLPFSTAINDEAEMTNAYGIGVTIDGVHAAIEYAIAIAQDYGLVPLSFDVLAAFDAATPTVTVPLDFIGIESVLAQEPFTLEWEDVPRANRRGGDGWFPDHAARRIQITGRAARAIHLRQLRLNGYGVPALLDSDDDVTTLDPEWLVSEAVAHICLDVVNSRQISPDWYQKGLLHKQQADALRSRLCPPLGSTFTRF